MKTQDLSGSLLDYWVARADGEGNARLTNGHVTNISEFKGWSEGAEYMPSTEWALGGPIIEREQITICAPDFMLSALWEAFIEPILDVHTDDIKGKFEGYGPTPLIAAMRVFVASKFGEEIPDESQP